MAFTNRLLALQKWTKGDLNTKLHAVTDSVGRSVRLFISAGQVNGSIGARALCSSLSALNRLIADRGYDADWCREVLQDNGNQLCILGRTPRVNKSVRYDKRRYMRRNRPSQRMLAFACRAAIEIMFCRLKDWRRIATRYDRCT